MSSIKPQSKYRSNSVRNKISNNIDLNKEFSINSNVNNLKETNLKITSNIPISKRTNAFISKTPDSKIDKPKTPGKSITRNLKLFHDEKNDDNLTEMKLDKALNNINQLATIRKPTLSKDFLKKICYDTPNCPRELKFAKDAKYNPKFETGIPWIKPKKTTKIIPFNFASTERAKLRKQQQNQN